MYTLNFGYGVPGVLGGLGSGYVQPSFMVSNNGILYFGRIKKPSDEKKRKTPKKKIPKRKTKKRIVKKTPKRKTKKITVKKKGKRS